MADLVGKIISDYFKVKLFGVELKLNGLFQIIKLANNKDIYMLLSFELDH